MIVLRDDTSAFHGETVLTIGKYDGIHRAHQMILRRLRERAGALGVQAGMVTFDPHPAMVLQPERVPALLTSAAEKEALLRDMGLDVLLFLSFNRELMQTRAADFMARLAAGLRPRELWVGEDFAMGYQREGTVTWLRAWAEPRGIAVQALPLLRVDGEVVSGSRIRALLAAGAVEAATQLLGRPPMVSGPVVQGDQRGRTIGFATANLLPPEGHALPANGVYVTWARLPDGLRYPSVTNVGVRPTFAGTRRQVECHLLDWQGDLYGKPITVEFLHRLRAEQRFEALSALVAQIRADAVAASRWFDEQSGRLVEDERHDG